MAAVLSCSGELTTSSGLPQCSGQWDMVFQPPPFDPTQLDPALLAQAFAAGFILPATFMIMSIGIRSVLSFIKSD